MTTAGRSRASTATAVLGFGAVIVVLAFAVVAAVGFDRAHDLSVEADVDRTATFASTRALDRIDGLVEATVGLARQEAGTRTSVDTAGLLATTTVSVDPSDRTRTAGGQLGPLGDPLAHREIAAALDLARDTASAVVSAPIVVDDVGTPVVAVAIYAVADGSLSLEPDETGTRRRQTIRSFQLAVIDTDELAGLVAAQTVDIDVGGRLTDGPTLLATAGEAPAFGETTVALPVRNRAWTLTLGATSVPTPPTATWVTLIAGVVAAAAMAALTWRALAEQRRLAEERGRAVEQLRVVTEIAPVVQETLDLARVLPTACLRIVDELDLAGVACAVVGDEGHQVEVFAFGAGVDSSVPAQLGVPDRVDADRTIAISLERGSRSVGVLRVRTGRPLRQDELVPLAAVADLTTAAIVNAQIFDEQRRTVERLQEVDHLKTVFLGTASHELRTPVTAITGFARLLETNWEDMDDGRRRSMAGRISANAIALDGLVSDLLDFARLERGALRAAAEPVDLSALVAGSLDRLGPVYQQHELVADVQPGVMVLGDTSGLERVIANLLSNAAKFSPEGSTVLVTVREGRDDWAELIVDDEGPGVPEADRDRIFSRFFRGAGAEVVRTRGAGIGLSVVTELCEQMAAEIVVDTGNRGGARFVVRFPPLDGAPGGESASGAGASGGRTADDSPSPSTRSTP